MRERTYLRAWPLTPIHIGTGEELTPESYVLDVETLRRFNPFGALARASAADRALYDQRLRRGDFVGAQKDLAKLAIAAGLGGEAVPVSPASLSDLGRVLAGESVGKGGVRPFVRDGDAVILPGSSLKGALRTAWIADVLTADQERRIAGAIPKNGTQTRRAADLLNDLALEIEPRLLEQDPFRDVAVADAPIPSGRTRYDRAVLGKRDADKASLRFEETGGMQMHLERLDSLADGRAGEPIAVAIDLPSRSALDARESLAKGRGKRITPKRPVEAPALWSAINRFHADLWLYECERFYATGPEAILLQRLLSGFGLTADSSLAEQLDRAGLLLVRVGRYAQFESKAVKVAGERHGLKARTVNRQTGEKPARLMNEGGTRTTCEVAPGVHAPFGWLMLALPDKGPAAAPKIEIGDLARRAQPGSPPPRPAGRSPSLSPVQSTAALAGRFKFRKGETVEHPDFGRAVVARDVGLNDSRIEIDFDGEVDDLAISGWARV